MGCNTYKLNELLDRLIINQLKIFKKKDPNDSHIRSLNNIVNSIDKRINDRSSLLTVDVIDYIYTLVYVNSEIWNLRDQMINENGQFNEHMKKSHQLNALRNLLKINIEATLGSRNVKGLDISNYDMEDLKGWNINTLNKL